jgi:thiol-disulfide isomerase/thioredoxin
VGNFQGKGIGKKLLEAAETDAKSLCAQGIVAWGIRLPFFMRSKWFKKHGYTSIDKDGMLELVWKPFSEDAVAPKLSKLKKKPTKRAGVVTITCLRNGWCPAQNLTVERIKRLVQEYPGSINYVEIDTEKRENLDDWGVSDQVFIDDKSLNVGPPPSYAKLKKLITKKVKALPKVS